MGFDLNFANIIYPSYRDISYKKDYINDLNEQFREEEKQEKMSEQTMKIILVHGGAHGAWCWYKVLAALRSQGYSVEAIDLAACGSDPRRIGEDVSSFEEYIQPLMELMASVPEGEKVVLVGHSFGGLSLASAMDAFPQKVAVAVFVSAVLPDTANAPWHIFQQHSERYPDKFSSIIRKNVAIPGRSEPFTISIQDPETMRTLLYQNCSFEDLILANIMVRPSSMFQEELSKKLAFSEEGFGSVDKVFIICGDDALLPADFQRWMVEKSSVKEVMEIKGADHMAMLSKPQELCQCITTIVSKYAN